MPLTNSWRPAATLNWTGETDNALPVYIQAPFTKKIIKTETRASNVKARWRRAGYLQQISITGEEGKNVVIPLNTSKVFGMPLIFTGSYRFVFTPVTWLDEGLRFRIYEYTGPDPDEALMQELLFMQ